jgi:membrane-associated phospholipid phosphatase
MSNPSLRASGKSRAGVALFSFALVSSVGVPALATPLEAHHGAGYYVAHGSLALGGFAGAGLASLVAPPTPGIDPFPNFGPDVAVRANFNLGAARLSDFLLYSTIAIPALAQLYDGFEVPMANAELIYSEAHAANFLLTSITKFSVRRPRPYTHSSNPRVQEFARGQGEEAHLSFFSGHSSSSYTAAMSGSILFALRNPEAWASHTMFGLEFALATFTAQLRVRAGRHYRTDVWIGSLVGAGIGLSVPALHGLPLSRVQASEWATAAGATALMVTLSEAVDVCKTFSLCSVDDEARVHEVPAGARTGPTWVLLPQAWPLGIAALGEF